MKKSIFEYINNYLAEEDSLMFKTGWNKETSAKLDELYKFSSQISKKEIISFDELTTIRKYAVSKGGFLTSGIRKIFYQKFYGINDNNKSTMVYINEDEETNKTEPFKMYVFDNDEKNKDSSNEYKNTLELLVSTIIAEQSEEQSAKVKANIEKLKSVVKERFGSLCSALEEVDEHNAGSMPVGNMYVKNLIKTVKPSDMCMLLLDDEEWEKVQTESRAEIEKILKKNDRALDYFKKHFVY